MEGVEATAKQALETTTKLNKLFDTDSNKINTLGRAKFSCIKTLEYLKKLPQVSVKSLSEELDMTAPTARAALNNLLILNIVEEISGKKKDKVYVYREYLNILEYGAKPFPPSLSAG